MPVLVIFTASPLDTSRLRLDREVRDIMQVFRTPGKDDFRVFPVPATRPSDMRRAILEHKPTIIHFCGHGERGSGVLLEDDYGFSQSMSSEALAGFLGLFKNTLECVVLNACYTSEQAEILSQELDLVVGVSGPIGDRKAVKFAVAFYEALRANESYNNAFSIAHNSLLLDISELEPEVKIFLHDPRKQGDKTPASHPKSNINIPRVRMIALSMVLSISIIGTVASEHFAFQEPKVGDSGKYHSEDQEEIKTKISESITQLGTGDPATKRQARAFLIANGELAAPDLALTMRDLVDSLVDNRTQQMAESVASFNFGSIFTMLTISQQPSWQEKYLENIKDLLIQIGQPAIQSIIEAIGHESEQRDALNERLEATQTSASNNSGQSFEGLTRLFEYQAMMVEYQKIGLIYQNLISALIQIGPPAVVEMRRALDDERPLIRIAGVQVLAKAAQPKERVIPLLERLQEDPDPDVRTIVLHAIETLQKDSTLDETVPPEDTTAPSRLEAGSSAPNE